MEICIRFSSGGFTAEDSMSSSLFNRNYTITINQSLSLDQPGFPAYAGSGGTSIYGPFGRDVADPDIANAPATWHFNDILSFPPWLGMDDRPGDFVSRGFGRTVSSFDEMPTKLRDFIKQRHPEIYENPAVALRG